MTTSHRVAVKDRCYEFCYVLRRIGMCELLNTQSTALFAIIVPANVAVSPGRCILVLEKEATDETNL